VAAVSVPARTPSSFGTASWKRRLTSSARRVAALKPARLVAGPNGQPEDLTSGDLRSEVPQLTNAELVQLRIRVIALENLVVALLAEASDRQLDLAREMAGYISPRPGFTHHPLTIHAAVQMINLVERADRFRDMKPS
jgi:hypothetical protein